MKTVLIDEGALTSSADLHSMLKRDLEFPSYYGGNLAALDDCLGDLDYPVRIDICKSEHAPEWFESFKKVLKRAAKQNSLLTIVEIERESDAMLLHALLGNLSSASGSVNDAAAANPQLFAAPALDGREEARNLASGSDGDRFECSACGCRISDLLEESRYLFDGIPFCPNCGREIANPGGSESMKWVSELI